MTPSPPVAVITPTHQRRSSLARMLEGLAAQSCPPDFFSVIVVCDGSTDGTLEMLRDTRRPFDMRVVEVFPARGPAAARNLAVSLVDSEIILFLDDDVIADPNLVTCHAAHHQRHRAAVVIGPLLAPNRRQEPWLRWEAETLRRQYNDMTEGAWEPTPRQFYTGNASVRREHVVSVGGFDPRFRRGEDVDLAFRLKQRGLTFIFEPRAFGVHIPKRSFRSWLSAAYEYGRAEPAMNRPDGSPGLVKIKVGEFQRRHSFVRRFVEAGLSSPASRPALFATARVAGRVLSTIGLWRFARGAYTALFELNYWRGVEDATGVPAWRVLSAEADSAGPAISVSN